MKAKIIKIDPLKESRNKGNSYRRVYFQVKDFEIDREKAVVKTVTKWAKTDLVPKFRNYKKWVPVLKVGNILEGIRMKGESTVDADSNITVLYNQEITEENQKIIDEKVEQLRLL